MGSTVRPWLPESAVTASAVQRGISEAVAGWCHHWFTRATAVVTAVRTGEPGGPSPGELACVAGSIRITLPERAKALLLSGVMAAPRPSFPTCEADGQVLTAFLQKVAEDLLARLTGLAAVKEDSSGCWTQLEITLNGQPIFSVAVKNDLLVRWIKLGLPLHPSGRPPLPRSAALRRAKIGAYAYFGEARLSVPEAKALATGDVLVLDRTVDSPVELRLSGRPAPFACGRLLRGEDHRFSLQLERMECQ